MARERDASRALGQTAAGCRTVLCSNGPPDRDNFYPGPTRSYRSAFVTGKLIFVGTGKLI